VVEIYKKLLTPTQRRDKAGILSVDICEWYPNNMWNVYLRHQLDGRMLFADVQQLDQVSKRHFVMEQMYRAYPFMKLDTFDKSSYCRRRAFCR